MNDVTSILEAQQAVIERLKRELDIASRAAVALHAQVEQLEAVIAAINGNGGKN